MISEMPGVYRSGWTGPFFIKITCFVIDFGGKYKNLRD